MHLACKVSSSLRFLALLNSEQSHAIRSVSYTHLYASSKGAVVQFTEAVANEWSKYGINANAIAPGFIETPMTLDMKENRCV